MSADRHLDASLARASSLQAQICGRADTLELPEEPKLLVREMRDHLVNASDEGLLETPAHDIFKLLKESASPIDRRPEYRGIYGGEKDLKRTGTSPGTTTSRSGYGRTCTRVTMISARRRRS